MRALPVCICVMLLRSALAATPAENAAAIVKDSGWKRGVCVDAGADPQLAIELARASELSIYRVEKNAAAVASTRKLAEAAGLSPLRLRVEVGPLAELEYPDYVANLVIAPGATKEVLRLLRPAGGVAYLASGGAAPAGHKAGRGPGGRACACPVPVTGRTTATTPATTDTARTGT